MAASVPLSKPSGGHAQAHCGGSPRFQCTQRRSSTLRSLQLRYWDFAPAPQCLRPCHRGMLCASEFIHWLLSALFGSTVSLLRPVPFQLRTLRSEVLGAKENLIGSWRLDVHRTFALSRFTHSSLVILSDFSPSKKAVRG